LAIEHSMGLAVLRHREKKPRGLECVLRYFNGAEAEELLVVGDRLLTDVVFGNLHGMLTVSPTPPMRTSTSTPSLPKHQHHRH
jgi:phosphatidylglycerophosphatase GEP4